MWHFIWLDIDSSLQTNDSKWLDSSCDSIRKNFRRLWLYSDSKGLWLRLNENESDTSLLATLLSVFTSTFTDDWRHDHQAHEVVLLQTRSLEWDCHLSRLAHLTF